MPRRNRSLMPPHWPPISFTDALHDEDAADEDDPSDVDAHDPLTRLDAVTASSAWQGAPKNSVALVQTSKPGISLEPDAYRGELEQIGREIEGLRLLLIQSEREIEAQAQRRELAQQEVAKIEERLQQHSHEEIRAAYAYSSEAEMRAFMASEQRDKLIAKLQAFERYERFLRSAIEALDAATATEPSLDEGDWNLASNVHTLPRYDDVIDGPDDYEARWMTPTSPIPTVTITDTSLDKADDWDHPSADSSIQAHIEAVEEEHAASEYAEAELDHAAISIPLPRPQVPEEHTQWVAQVSPIEEVAPGDGATAGQSQHVVVMGPRTASLSFQGEEQGQWHGAHTVLNRVVQAQEEVAERVARQIQDGSMQALTQLALEADYFEQQAANDPKAALAGLQQMRSQLNAALQSANSALLSIRPIADGSTSLVGALRRYAISISTQYGLPFELHTEDREPSLPPQTVKLAFRVGQEAMLNAARHAHASLLRISVSHNADVLRLAIQDDGVGFDAEQEATRAIKRSAGGLLGILERAELLGGSLRIDSMPGSGCTVELQVPLPHR